jgi:hypothetical protein
MLILVYKTGLFSAALAAALSVSIQGFQPSLQDTFAFYLGNIYHLLVNTTTQPTASNPPKFSPPKSAVLVNALWFLSPVTSLTGALLSIFIQQWAQFYLLATRGRYDGIAQASELEFVLTTQMHSTGNVTGFTLTG